MRTHLSADAEVKLKTGPMQGLAGSIKWSQFIHSSASALPNSPTSAAVVLVSQKQGLSNKLPRLAIIAPRHFCRSSALHDEGAP